MVGGWGRVTKFWLQFTSDWYLAIGCELVFACRFLGVIGCGFVVYARMVSAYRFLAADFWLRSIMY